MHLAMIIMEPYGAYIVNFQRNGHDIKGTVQSKSNLFYSESLSQKPSIHAGCILWSFSIAEKWTGDPWGILKRTAATKE